MRISLRNNLDKNSKLVTLLGLDVGKDVNQSLSLSEVLHDLVSGKLISIERSCDSVSLNILNSNFDLFGHILDIELMLLNISQTYFKNSSLKKILYFLSTSWFLNWSPTNLLDISNSLWRHDSEPFLFHECMFVRVLLLVVLLVDFLVLSLGHFVLDRKSVV